MSLLNLIRKATEAARAAGGYAHAPDVGEELLAIHNTRPDRIVKADQLGGFAVPSIAIAKPSLGFDGFGDISLIADPMLIKPGRKNPVFAADAYTPRFPSLNDEGTKIFRGFTDAGNRRYAPLTLENLVREMKGNIRGGEGFGYGAGSVRAAITPQFSNLKDIQNARGSIISDAEFEPLKEGMNHRLIELASEFYPYSKYQGNQFIHTDDFASMLGDYRGSSMRLKEHYKPDLPEELLEKTREFMRDLRTMPTEYFEAKPQRAVGIGEFKGAVIPDDVDPAARAILEKHGLSITPYETFRGKPDGEKLRGEARKSALQDYKHLFFGIPAAMAMAPTFGSLVDEEGI